MPAIRSPFFASTSPLEMQFLAIKQKHPDCIVMMHVGYKFRFFNNDASVASAILGIHVYQGKSMLAASVPLHRGSIHATRLVKSGFKVAVVKQSQLNSRFIRHVDRILTPATLRIASVSIDTLQSSSSILAIHRYSSCASILVKLCLTSLELEIRRFNADVCLSGAGLDSAVLEMDVAEVVLDEGDAYSLGKGLDILITRRNGFQIHANDAKLILCKLVDPAVQQWISLVPQDALPPCLVLLQYLNDVGLTEIFKSELNVAVASNWMRFTPATVSCLQLVFSSAGRNGTLLALLDHTRSSFCRRRLKNWILNPLIRFHDIQARLNAVDELVLLSAHSNGLLEDVQCEMNSISLDLELCLTRLFFATCSPRELFLLLSHLYRLSCVFDRASVIFSSSLLSDIVSAIQTIRPVITELLSRINEESAKSNSKVMFLHSMKFSKDLQPLLTQLNETETQLHIHLAEIQCQYPKLELQYKTVAAEDFLIELPNDLDLVVPCGWIKFSSTKHVSRFRSPTILKLVNTRNRFTEQLSLACDAEYLAFTRRINEDLSSDLKAAINAIAVFDCLCSFSTVAMQQGFCRPSFDTTTKTRVLLKNSTNPLLPLPQMDIVTNDIGMDDSARRCMVLTGPNMGGKSSLCRQVALTIIMAQIGCYVAANSATLSIFDAVFVRMCASDDIFNAKSTLMNEMLETSFILNHATEASLVVLDELGRGTSTFDGAAIAFATLDHLVNVNRCTTLFTTHYSCLTDLTMEGVFQAHMGFCLADGGVVFLYRLSHGCTKFSHGINVAKVAGIHQDVIKVAIDMTMR